LRVDEARRELWATSAVVPQMEGFTAESNGKAAVFRFDLATAKLLSRVDAPADGKLHNLNDLTLDAKGNAYVSDPFAGVVYRLARDGKELEVFVKAGVVRSPQGLALSADEKKLYVADYGKSLVAIDMVTGDAKAV